MSSTIHGQTQQKASVQQEHIALLYHDHHHWLARWLYKRVNCLDLAADITHDTFVRLLGKTIQLDSALAARRYLRTLANGLCVDLWRRKSVEKAWLETLATHPEPVDISPEARAIIIETLCEIDAMLSRLPEKVAIAFTLSQLDGLTYQQIAHRLGVSERTIKTYMAKAMYECLLIQTNAALT